MTQMIAKTLPEYAGRKLAPGDAFECEPQHAELLEKIGLVESQRADTGSGNKRARKQPALDLAKA
jgi:hypothetical protein